MHACRSTDGLIYYLLSTLKMEIDTSSSIGCKEGSIIKKEKKQTINVLS